MLTLLLSAITLALAPPAHAQQAAAAGGDTRHMAGLGFGQVFLMGGDDATLFHNHIGFNVNYGFESGPTWGLLVNFHLSSHGDDLNPNDSLSFKGLTPNLKVNFYRNGQFVVSAFAGMGLYLVDETVGTQSSSFFLFAMDAGLYPYADLGPHFRVGPSLSFIYIASGTNIPDPTTSGAATSPMSAGGNNIELFFNLTYIF